MNNEPNVINVRAVISNVIGWIFCVAVLVVGLLNMFLVHPVPGIVYLLLSLVYFPPTNTFLRKTFGYSIPLVVKLVLALIIVIFTLGVSDLGDMID